MKVGKSLQELVVELERQAKSKRDFVADSRRLSYVPDPTHGIVLEGVNGGMKLRATAHQQMAASLGIPKPFYDRLLTEMPDLLALNANRLLGNEIAYKQMISDEFPGALDYSPSKGMNRLVRTLDGEVRAVLSDSYRPLDNLDLAEAVLPGLVHLHAQVMATEVTENRFYLKAVTDRVSGEVKKGDVVQAGVVVSNSEVGQGSLRVEALDYWLICLNGMVREVAVRKAHLSRRSKGADDLEDSREYFRDETRAADDKAFFLKVKDTTAAMFDPERFYRRLEQYQEATELQITKDPVQVVEVTSKRFGLTDDERSSVLQHLIRGGDLSQYGLSNAITRAAQDVESFDRSYEMEKFGGEVVELKSSEWKVLAA